jgi:hypothetical protein
MTSPGSHGPDPIDPSIVGVVPPPAPPPPAGPGVQPPFAAPPTEGDQRRVWIGLGVGGLAVLLCCIGGVIGIAALLLTSVQAIDEQARATVRHYLDAIQAHEYDDAYGLLCDAAQNQESRDEFAQRISSEPDIASYQLEQTQVAEQVIVPADVQYAGGERESINFVLAQDRDTGQFEVCGTE